jgi:hypothetical protein
MVDRRLFTAVVIQGYQLILQGIALKTCLILSSLLEPKWSQSVQNLSLPRFASNRNGSDTVRLDPAIFAVLPLSDPPLCFNTCVILRADNSSGSSRNMFACSSADIPPSTCLQRR